MPDTEEEPPRAAQLSPNMLGCCVVDRNVLERWISKYLFIHEPCFAGIFCIQILKNCSCSLKLDPIVPNMLANAASHTETRPAPDCSELVRDNESLQPESWCWDDAGYNPSHPTPPPAPPAFDRVSCLDHKDAILWFRQQKKFAPKFCSPPTT